MPYEYFTDEELTCHCGCGAQLMSPHFMRKLIRSRRRLGFPLVISSAYRCPTHNAEVSETGLDGPHTKGRAIDILINRYLAAMLVREALDAGFLGIGLRQHGPDSGRIVHLDTIPRSGQVIWTY